MFIFISSEVGDKVSKYKFEFDLSVSIQDVLDADDGKLVFDNESFDDSDINVYEDTFEKENYKVQENIKK